jgi:hypothetical protein
VRRCNSNVPSFVPPRAEDSTGDAPRTILEGVRPASTAARSHSAPGFFTRYGGPQGAVSAVETTWCRAERRSGRARPLEPRRARLCRRRHGRHGGKLLRLVSAATARASGGKFSSALTSPGRSATSVASAPGSNPPSRRTESTVGGETARQTAPPNAWLKQIRRPPATAEPRDEAERHTHKATTLELKQLWAKVAIERLKHTGDEARAIREANAVSRDRPN